MDSVFIMDQKLPFLALLLLSFFCIIEGLNSSATKIGAILDLDSRMGKEQKMAMQIAVENFNNANTSIHFVYYNQNTSLQTALAAEALIKETKVEALVVGIDSWKATSLVAQVGALSQVPVLSLTASPPITSPFTSIRWPFLVQLSPNTTQEVNIIASIINSYHWRRVIVVYEDDISNNYGTISLLTKALQNFGIQIEHNLVLPPYASTNRHPRSVIQEKMNKLIKAKYYSRVFIVLGVSLPYVSYLFEEAQMMELMSSESVWIITETISNFLPSFTKSTMSNMTGVIGTMTKFDNTTADFDVFEAKFGTKFLDKYKYEMYQEPNFQALLAYDAITTIMKAKHSLNNTCDDAATPKFLKEILRANFTGLSGQIVFNEEQKLLADNANTRLVNINNSNYREVMDFTNDDVKDKNAIKTLASKVAWPGHVTGGINPKGWAMDTFRIAVPVKHKYNNFIAYENKDICLSPNHSFPSYTNEDFKGYCIKLFQEVLNISHSEGLHYQFIPHCGPYDDIINHVYNKMFDAAVGDFTILAARTELVDFTLPYEESGLSIVLRVNESYNSPRAWIFLKPFTTSMWVVNSCAFLYTMFIIWALENPNNSTFRGPWRNQLSTTTWFALNSIYFAQREAVTSKSARAVVIIWSLIVLILTTSYTANLTSMITNERLNQTPIDIEMLQRTNAKVGYDKSSFIKKFLEPLKFKEENMIEMRGDFEEIHQKFQNGSISAACLEYLHAQLFQNTYCNKYIMTKPIYRFGGFGFGIDWRTNSELRLSRALTVLDNTNIYDACRRLAARKVDALLLTDANALLWDFYGQGRFRHLPVVENGEVVALLDIAKCLYDAIACMKRAIEKGKAIVAAVEVLRKIRGHQLLVNGEYDYKTLMKCY
ncbi:glutamate receptor 2.7 isoform X2 [Beta vulgaris subsp. vulgaris]|uniref:glutamate receptor 2.7 isoform X2 n=1 Tax=Beta vulgaris subsp. vulgaris TaxID=3555 RepID=UPI0009011EDE|nr:glutamate receptor 2.7 isoform X2 [Beta vulgaris subsp. vulgaris]